jgi:hypothetical protein
LIRHLLKWQQVCFQPRLYWSKIRLWCLMKANSNKLQSRSQKTCFSNNGLSFTRQKTLTWQTLCFKLCKVLLSNLV